MSLAVRVLGEVEVATADGWRRAGPAKRGCVLAALALTPGAAVSLDELSRRLWGSRPPVSAYNTLYGHIARLRSLLAGCADPPTIRTAGSDGYLLDVDAERVDLHAARALAARARRQDDAAATRTWRRACDLFDAEPLRGIDSDWTRRLRSAINSEHAAMLAELFSTELRLGRHDAVAAQLVAHVSAHPLSEGLVECLMTALYRCGRQTEALDHYRAVQRRLDAEAGVEPGPRLRRLHRDILNHDATLEPGRSLAPATVAIPRTLPAAPRGFVGRSDALSALDTAVPPGDGPCRLWTVTGPGGIGKSWLVRHWAHRHRDAFPDGQLYLNLRGFDAAGHSVTPDDALRDLLQGLGVPTRALPTGTEALSGLFRTVTSDRRILLVIDDAFDAAQVTPLLPGDGNVVTVVTSRSELTPLATTHGARGLRLSYLPEADAHDALATLLGAQRLAAEPAAAAELLTACAGLPLAVGILAARIAARPLQPLSVFADATRDGADRLDLLDAGELSTSLRSVLDASVRNLSRSARDVFKFLALAPGSDADLRAVASLADMSTLRVRGPLRELERTGLVEQHRPHRYRMHDLTRLYARELADELDHDKRIACSRRVVTHYMDTAFAVKELIAPDTGNAIPPPPPARQSAIDRFDGVVAARKWIDQDVSNAFEAHRVAADNGWDELVWHLSAALFVIFARRRDFARQLIVSRRCETAARNLDDTYRLVIAWSGIGSAACDLGDHDTAVEYLTRAYTTAENTFEGRSLPMAHHDLSRSYSSRGDFRRAVEHSTRSLSLVGDNHNRRVVVHNSVGWQLAHLGEFDQARIHCETALELARETDNYHLGHILDSLGFIESGAGDALKALAYYEQAIAFYRRRGVLEFGSRAMLSLAKVHDVLGSRTEATRLRRSAADLYEAEGYRQHAALVRRELT